MITTPTTSKRRSACGVLALLVAATLGGCMTPATYNAGEMAMSASGVPTVPAFLPMQASVPRTEVLPIDGTWNISSIGRTIRIEAGRAYAVDGWLHAFVLQVQPGHVVLKSIRRTGPGSYAAEDLPLMGAAQFALQPDGRLRATVAGMMPAQYDLLPEALDNPAAMQAELASMGGITIQPAPGPGIGNDPGGDPLANCTEIAVDPNTDEIICAD